MTAFNDFPRFEPGMNGGSRKPVAQDSRTKRRARWTINGFLATKGLGQCGIDIIFLSDASAWQAGPGLSFCNHRESDTRSVGHGETLPPDQVAGGRARNRVKSAAADHPDGLQASARMVSRAEMIKPSAPVPAQTDDQLRAGLASAASRS